MITLDVDVAVRLERELRKRCAWTATGRSSDGRVPVRPEAEARRDQSPVHGTDAPEFMSVWDRCISRGAPGWIIPAGYNNAYQILQAPGYVVIHWEMSHNARIMPLDGRPPLPPAMRFWGGVSRGRWEGDTLVVETTNFTDKNWTATSAASGRIKGIPKSEALRIVERFTRVAADRIDYLARIEDPGVFTQPWTLAFPWTRDDEYQIYEYACHEGNHAVANILRGARAGATLIGSVSRSQRSKLGDDMNSNVYWVLGLNVETGRESDVRVLMAEMVSATKANETGALNYEWSMSADGTLCHIFFERYADSAAVLTHLGTFGQRFAGRFLEVLKPVRFVVYGAPDAAVKEALAGFSPVYMQGVGGFSR